MKRSKMSNVNKAWRENRMHLKNGDLVIRHATTDDVRL